MFLLFYIDVDFVLTGTCSMTLIKERKNKEYGKGLMNEPLAG